MEELKRKIEDLISNNASNFEIAKVIKENLKNYYATLSEVFKKSGGKDFLIKHIRKIDSIIKLAYYVATRESFFEFFPSKNAIPLTINALGSYGREQLSPKSDIDIMFIYKEIPGYNTKEIIQNILYLLWDVGLKLGHRVHEISELEAVADSDVTIKTAMLEARFVDGSKYLWVEIENVLSRIRQTKQLEFVKAKIKERRELRKKYPLMMEPNLKEGVGGFRDANIVFWIGKLLFNVPNIKELPTSIVNERDYAKFRSALEFLFKVRSALHLVVEKKTDHLRLEYIPDVSELLGYGKRHMIFSKRVHKALRTIWLYSRIWLEKIASLKGVVLYSGYLCSNSTFSSTQEALEFLIKNANTPFRAHPRLNEQFLRLHEKEPTKPDTTMIIELFKAPYTSSILQALNEVGVLGFYIPPLKKIDALPQFDGYHKYTVDMHLIKCVEALENIQDSFIKELFESLNSKDKLLLKMITLLHDAGKGRIKDHHELGAALFRVYAKNLGLDEDFINLGSKLIMHHSLLSQTAQREDIYSHKVIAKFAGFFPSKRELDLILLLTYADTSGVGNNIYNEFNARLFKTLYENAMNFLQHKEFVSEMEQRINRILSLKRSAQFKALPKKLQRKILEIESNLPFIKYTTNRIIEIARQALETTNYRYIITNNKFLTIEIIRKEPIDLGYLLSKLRHLNIANLDIVRLFDGAKYFKIDFNQKVEEDEIQRIEQIIEASFKEQKRPILKSPQIKKEDIFIDCDHTNDYALLKLKAPDTKGLLAFIMNLFEEYQIEIVSAKSSTIKKIAYDLFLIEKNGNFCIHKEEIVKRLSS